MSFFNDGSSVRVMKLSEWLNMAAGQNPDFKVVLPMIQRGFVWKPRQIIELWDSLLQGMPIGTLMVSEMSSDMNSANLSKSVSDEGTNKHKVGLVDGQQRTLAMLAGWAPFVSGESSHRLWVDFGDEPPAGECVRLRITTKNQPFGYRRDDPNGKLTLDDKRRARQRFYKCEEPQKIDRKEQTTEQFEKGLPYPAGAKLSLPLDLTDLLAIWRNVPNVEFNAKVEESLQKIEFIKCKDDAVEKAPVNPWQRSTDADKAKIRERIDRLTEGFAKLMTAEIPLLKVNPEFFELDKSEGAEPPLARLFKRIGSNATPLSDADYVYSILKHLMPSVHEMVERLHGQQHHEQYNVAALLTPTDLVMSALRLAAIGWNVTDLVKPNKDDFHRMIWPKESKEISDATAESKKRQDDLLNFMDSKGKHSNKSMKQCFELVTTYLEFKEGGDTGLPRHVFPYLRAPLVQVLLRLAHSGYLTTPVSADRRADVLRLVLYWMQWVNQVGYPDKASRTAFAVIKEAGDVAHNQLGMMIYRELVKEKLSLSIASPEDLTDLNLHKSVEDADKNVLGESRFATPDSHSARERQIRGFYRQWWRPWTFRHPMLLWLQRDYVHGLAGDPMAGMDDDIPYDFDHILPQSHWSGWTGALRGNRFPDCFHSKEESQYDVIGNAIGNVRVWDAPGNRSDGDASPKYKRPVADEKAEKWMKDSVITDDDWTFWERCSPEDERKKKEWDPVRALAFQQAVEHRTFDLYKRLYHDAGFRCWLDSNPELT